MTKNLLLVVTLFWSIGCHRIMPTPLEGQAGQKQAAAELPIFIETPIAPIKRKVIVLMEGQSNMMGIPQTKPFQTSPAVHMVYANGDQANMYGPGASALLFYTQANPGVEAWGIMCAKGSTSINEWQAGGFLLEPCLARARALRDSEKADIIGMFFDQGEQDAYLGTPDWPQKLTALARYSASQLNVCLPVIYTQLGQTDDTYGGKWAPFQLLQAEAQQPGFQMIITDDLPAIGHVHHDYDANLEIGRRFSVAMNNWD